MKLETVFTFTIRIRALRFLEVRSGSGSRLSTSTSRVGHDFEYDRLGLPPSKIQNLKEFRIPYGFHTASVFLPLLGVPRMSEI